MDDEVDDDRCRGFGCGTSSKVCERVELRLRGADVGDRNVDPVEGVLGVRSDSWEEVDENDSVGVRGSV